MTEAETLFNYIGTAIENSEKGQLFGKACFKTGGKAYICFFEDEMVFKLTKEAHTSAIELEGSQLFDPSKKNRPMKEWVQVPFAHKDQWQQLANEASEYVTSLIKK